MRVVQLMLLMTFFLSSCSEKMGKKERYVKELSTNYREFHFLIVVPVYENNDTVNAVVSNTDLYHAYVDSLESKYESFEFMLEKVVEKEIILSGGEIFGSFIPVRINDEIVEEYYKLGPDLFFKKYLEVENGKYRIIDAVEDRDVPAILKLAFENFFYISFDDYGGEYILLKDIPYPAGASGSQESQGK